MQKIETIVVNDLYKGRRIDLLICEKFPEISRNFVHGLFKSYFVTVNEIFVSKHYRVRFGDFVKIVFPATAPIKILAENIPLEIVYEDDDLIVVNKQKGMVVHPAPGHFSKTLVNALMWHCGGELSKIGGDLRPGIVHRIDKDTSGLLVVAKTDLAYKELSLQIREHSFDRFYDAIVHGRFKERSGVVNFPIGRSELDRKKMAVNFKNGKFAITEYYVVEEFSDFTYLRLKLKTGRTHQIRVHMAYIGHSLVGDESYGKKNDIYKLNGQCLHAKTIGFCHPRTGINLKFETGVDYVFKNFLNWLRLNCLTNGTKCI